MIKKHFCVSVYVFCLQNKKFLLIKHKKTGRWLQPGGHIEINEDPEEAAIREAYEETGITVKLTGRRFPGSNDFIRPLALQKHVVAENHVHIDIVYLAHPLSSNITKLNTRETDGVEWFSLGEIIDKKFNTFDDVRFWCQHIHDKTLL